MITESYSIFSDIRQIVVKERGAWILSQFRLKWVRTHLLTIA